MKETTGVTVILPIHYIDADMEKFFKIAIDSIKQQLVIPDKVLIVVPAGAEELIKFVNEFDYDTIKDITTVILNDGDSSFAGQMNCGVKNVTTEWFSFVESDDELSKIHLKNFIEYRTAYPEVGLFLPMVVDVDASNNFLALGNEAVWAADFSDELGFLDSNALLNYPNFNFDGMIMKKELYDEFGGMKPSIKLTFMYEFLLRMAAKSVVIMTIPKIGYKHMNQRPNSLFANYRTELTKEESDFWMTTAKNEYYFTYDRPIEFKPRLIIEK